MKKRKNNAYPAAGYLKAIIVIKKTQGAYYSPSLLSTENSGKLFAKYRNIKDDQAHKNKFAEFARRFPGAMYINFYSVVDRSYKGRLYLNQ